MLGHKLMGAAKSTAAAISYVGGTTAGFLGDGFANQQTISLTSLSGGVASQPAAGDVVIVYYGSSSTANRNITIDTSGYESISKLYANDTYDANLRVGYKVMGSSPDTSVVVSGTGNASDAGVVAVHVWRNADSSVPFEASPITATGTDSVLCNPPSITPTITGAVVVAGGSGAHNSGGSFTFSSSNLSNFITVGAPNETNDATIGLGSFAWTSGAFDPAAFTYSGSDSTTFSWAAASLALQPKYSGIVPTFVAEASQQNTTNGSSLVINKPTGTQQGDIMVAFMGTSGVNATWTGDTGWTEVADQGSGFSLRVAYKVAGASEGASYTFTASVATGKLAGTIVAYRNAAYDTVSTISENPSVTTNQNYSLVILLGGSTNASLAPSLVTNFTSRKLDSDANGPSYRVSDRLYWKGTLSLPASSDGLTSGSGVNLDLALDPTGILVSLKPA